MHKLNKAKYRPNLNFDTFLLTSQKIYILKLEKNNRFENS